MSSEPKTMKLAIYRNISANYESVCHSGFDDYSDYARISDHVEVTFPPLSSAIQIQHHLEALDRQEQKVRADFSVALDRLKDMRNQLLALPHLEVSQ